MDNGNEFIENFESEILVKDLTSSDSKFLSMIESNSTKSFRDLLKENLIAGPNSSIKSDNLETILLSRELIKERKAKDVKFAQPILKQGDNAIIFPNTINVIQGQAGVHKSRLAENICAAFLKKHDCQNELLGFKRTNFDSNHLVLYVDTERNQQEQLPFSLQSIQVLAGYKKEEHPHNFDYISLLEISRKDRFAALNESLDYIITDKTKPTFIVLDVSTDCIEDFNRIDSSMELIDHMNKSINKHNVIFLCLIHENPRSDKARGHFGSELMNKASTVMQVGYEKDASNNDTELIRIKYLKCRSSARHHPFYAKYCNEFKGLVLASQEDISNLSNSRKVKGKIEDIAQSLHLIFKENNKIVSKAELFTRLTKDFDISARTLQDRVDFIIEEEFPFYDEDGNLMVLSKERNGGSLSYTMRIKAPF